MMIEEKFSPSGHLKKGELSCLVCFCNRSWNINVDRRKHSRLYLFLTRPQT